MIKRVAFFAEKQEAEIFFGFNLPGEYQFNPQYNLAPGQHLPVVFFDGTTAKVKSVCWGKKKGSDDEDAVIGSEKAANELEAGKAERGIVLLSGFYIWKKGGEKDHPFFVRMINQPFIAAAGLVYEGEEDYCKLVMVEANPLIQPMTEEMPLLLDKYYALRWLDPKYPANNIVTDTKGLFLLTDLSATRVTKKVNDPSNNGPALIQPIPK